ncbi:ectoine synthase [Ancylobacter lacus]|uniref:ectoine synthase n=1 Tax=Ancylobacter lacus TaxID=2579970 RepID=UPI001BCDD97B|nr:ectoine synthase [Ancylobacter lacus]MBS7538312.1 ectoine synthase [Ancylobacter lacus]
MIVRDISELKSTDRHVITENWSSTRLIVKSDGLGYSVHHTVIPEGHEVHCHYREHFETNYCIAGAGEVLDIATGERHPIAVGQVYALDLHDEHIVRALKGDLHLVCVFNPPLQGDERHNAHGGYDAA